MYTHQTSLRVRYGETDQMGYLYYGNYAQYYEVGRVEALPSLGLSYKELESEHGILMPVMSLNMRFVRPAYYDELIQIKTVLKAMPTSTITFHVELFNEAAQLVNGGSVKLCFLDAAQKKSIPAPNILTHALAPYFE